MSSSHISPARLTWHRLLPLAAAYAAFLLALSIDILILYDTGLLEEGPPRFELIYLIRTLLVAISSGLLVFGLARGWPFDGSSAEEFDSGGRQAGAISAAGGNNLSSLRTISLVKWGLLGLSAGFVILFITDPHAFYEFGREDRFIEAGSALAWAVSGLMFFRISYLGYRRIGLAGKLLVLLPLVIALGCFLVGLEEISWFQRVLSYETPELIDGNLQNEFNLHNFATDQVENIYYAGIFGFLILGPFLFRTLLRSSTTPLISIYLAGPTVLFASSLAMAYNYDMWNILFTQLTFFITGFILVIYAQHSAATTKAPIPYFVLIASLVFTQVAFLLREDTFIRLWDVTEYKEFLIPLAVCLYAIEVQHRYRSRYPLREIPRRSISNTERTAAAKVLPLTDQTSDPS